MKILITTDWYSPVINGVVTSVLNLQKQLEAKGHEVKILTLSRDGSPKKNDSAYYVRSFHVRIYPEARGTYSFFKNKYVKELLAWKPDIIHSQCEWMSFIFAKEIAGKLHIPIVHTYHTIYEDYTHYFLHNQLVSKKLIRFGAGYALKRADYVITPTDKAKESLNVYDLKTPVTTVPTGIDLAKYQRKVYYEELFELRNSLGIPTEKKILSYVGRLGKEKNVDELIKNMKQLLKIEPNALLLIVGGGPYEEELKTLTGKLKLTDSVKFVGMVPPSETPKYYKLGHIFVCASQSEAQGLTYIEALACGIPSVCKDDKCLQGVIINGYNGYTYRNNEEYISYVTSILNMPEINYKRLCENAKTSSANYSTKIFAEKIEEVYTQAVKNYY